MVAAMPLITVSHTDKKPVTSTDLRNIAIGLAAAIAMIILAGQIADSGSVSVSDSELTDLSAKRFVSISLTSIATDSIVTTDEADAGFTVVGVTTDLGTAVTCSYGGVTDSVTSHATTGVFTCLFDDDGTGSYADMSGVADAGNVNVYATIAAGGNSGTASSTYFAEQDITDPTITITTT